MADHLIFGTDYKTCPVTGRPYEQGSGALPHEQQTANYVREAGIEADKPNYETDDGARTRVRRQMERSGASTKEIETALKNVVGGPECCPQTGRPYECGSGAITKTAQTRNFLNELTPAEKAQRQTAFDALVAAAPAGQA